MRLIIESSALEDIFVECSRHDADETGGRLLGVHDANIARAVLQIGPGPNARRTPTSFFQDGEWQEKEFRMVERRIRNIQHLGNWHTHHVNGLQTLSAGDVATYERTVNHPSHAINIFVALLVTRRLDFGRYTWRAFLFRRGVPGFSDMEAVEYLGT